MEERKVRLNGLLGKAESLSNEGKTPMFLAAGEEAAGIIAVADTLKENSKEAVEFLHRMGLEVAMLTGDNQRTAKAIARQIGIGRVFAEVLPAMKAEEVKRLQSEGKKVGMVGRRDQRCTCAGPGRRGNCHWDRDRRGHGDIRYHADWRGPEGDCDGHCLKQGHDQKY